MRTATTPSLSNDRHPVSSEQTLLQPTARLRQRGMPRVPAVALLHDARHQLHSQPTSARLERARLEARPARHAHLSARAVPDQHVLEGAAARPVLPSTV